jgi:hypothetical protein
VFKAVDESGATEADIDLMLLLFCYGPKLASLKRGNQWYMVIYGQHLPKKPTDSSFPCRLALISHVEIV